MTLYGANFFFVIYKYSHYFALEMAKERDRGMERKRRKNGRMSQGALRLIFSQANAVPEI